MASHLDCRDWRALSFLIREFSKIETILVTFTCAGVACFRALSKVFLGDGNGEDIELGQYGEIEVRGGIREIGLLEFKLFSASRTFEAAILIKYFTSQHKQFLAT